MNTEVLNALETGLGQALKERFAGADTAALLQNGKSVLTDALKSYVLKQGSKELEAILLEQTDFASSALRPVLTARLKAAAGAVPEAAEMADFSADYLVNGLLKAYRASGHSKDLDGICAFTGIDKSMLAMVNSPMGKLFGKFF